MPTVPRSREDTLSHECCPCVARLTADLEAAVTEARASCRDADVLALDNARLTARVGVLQVGCKCDPPGSGEEFCSGACYARAENARLRAFVERMEKFARYRGHGQAPNWSLIADEARAALGPAGQEDSSG